VLSALQSAASPLPRAALQEAAGLRKLRAMQRRSRQDPNAQVRWLLGGWRDLVVINDEAHHVYGEKRAS